MRKKKEPQLNLLNLMPRNKIAQELEAIAHLLDANQDILETSCKIHKHWRSF